MNLLLQTYPQRLAKGSSSNRKEMIKEEILEHHEGRKNNKNKNVSYRLSFLTWIYKFHLMIKPKILISSDTKDNDI